MTRRIAVLVFAAIIAMPAYAGFDEVLAGLHANLGHATWIPFFGLIRTGVRIAHPDGVHDMQLVVFEGKGSFDSLEADRIMRSRIGRDYTPLVRVRSKRDHEWSFVYAKPAGDLMDLVVLTSDGEDTVLVRVLVNPETVTTTLDQQPGNVALVARR
jgi:hypothetical protein